jgi:outer membrane protein assembly factor BamB
MVMKQLILIGIAAVNTAFAGWPLYHGGPSLKGTAEEELGDRLERAWRLDAGGAVYSTPVSDGERIYVAAQKGQVVALNPGGSVIWKKTLTRTDDAGRDIPMRFDAPLACADGLVFAGNTRGTLLALEAATGNVKWRYETEGSVAGSPNYLVPRHSQESLTVVVLDQHTGALHGINALTGARRWKTEGIERCDGSPGVGEAYIVFGSCLAALHVFGTDGNHLRDIEVDGNGQIAGGTAVDGRLAFAGLRDGRLVCADLKTGDMVWSSEESEEQTFSTPAVTAQQVVYTSDDGYVYAVGRQDGKTLWRYDTGGMPSSPVVAGDRVVVSADGILHLLSLSGGSVIWSKEISDEITAPAVIGGMIVVGADDGTVSGWRAAR